MQSPQLPPPSSAQVVHRGSYSLGWPCKEFSNSGISVRVVHRPSDSAHSIFTGDLEFDDDAGIDSSGLDVWSGACTILCSHIAANPELMRNFKVLELGSGMGVCGLFAAQSRFGAESVAMCAKLSMQHCVWLAFCSVHAVPRLTCIFVGLMLATS